MVLGLLMGLVFFLDAAAAEAPADLIVVEKAMRRLTLYRGDVPLRSYRVALGFSPSGDKAREGDGKTPEGRYTIDFKNAQSAFHLSLRISYPNAKDRAEASAQGLDPGGDIFIHGMPEGWNWVGPLHTVSDWTLGCIAVTNTEIEEIWRLVPVGTPIEIKP
ncbi:MAG: L,D-transpeptidase family protein [Alphaproteobacteria bacterium]|nr:L,D-transpeptidase family protein [Alphaproteobacteria bacterium]